MQWWLIFVSTPRFCCTAIDGLESCTEILVETKIDIGKKVDNIKTWLTN